MKKVIRPPSTSLNEESLRRQKIEALEALKSRANRSRRLQTRLIASRDRAMLCLATQVLALKFDFALSWKELSEELGGYVDNATIHKFANRAVWLSDSSYTLLCLGVNQFRKKKGIKEIEFPPIKA